MAARVLERVFRRPRSDDTPSMFLLLPEEIRTMVLMLLDSRSLGSAAVTWPTHSFAVKEMLMQRLALSGRGIPTTLPYYYSSHRRYSGLEAWCMYLGWLDERRTEAYMPVAAGFADSYMVIDGNLFGYGTSSQTEMFHTMYPKRLLDGIRINSVLCITGTCVIDRKQRWFDYTDHFTEDVVFNLTDFNVAVSVSGAVYTWGSGELGGLGNGMLGPDYARLPMRVESLSEHRVLSVAGCWGRCVAVTESGMVFSWGRDPWKYDSTYSQVLVSTPTIIAELTALYVRSVSVGKVHNLVVTEDGKLYSFGYGTNGQLGLGFDNSDFCSHPMQVELMKGVRVVASAAGDFHSVALTEDGLVYAWGNNSHGQLGEIDADNGIGTNEWIPKRIMLYGHDIDTVRGAKIAAGGHRTCVVSENGALKEWGLINYMRHRRPDESLHGVVHVSLNDTHAMVGTRDGRVFGWGEMEAICGNEFMYNPYEYTRVVSGKIVLAERPSYWSLSE